jgi:hypothetical protein
MSLFKLELTLAVSLPLCLATSAAAQSFSQMQQVAAQVKQEYTAAGYWVGEGRFGYFENEDCLAVVPIMGHCYGANPASPYGFYYLPQAPGEFRDPVYQPLVDALGGGSLWPSWRLRPDEAVVFIGMTPPKHAYFGFRSYLFSSRNLNALEPQTSPANFVLNESLDPSRREIFAALGVSTNNETIAAGSTPPFDAATVVVTTADGKIDQKLRASVARILQQMGITKAIVNTDRVPSDVVRLGYDKGADDFMMLARAAYPSDPAAADAYRAAPRGVVLRIVPRTLPPLLNLSAYKWTPVPERATGVTEDYLKNAQSKLAAAVAKRFGSATRVAEPVVSGTKLSMFIGEKCIKYGYGCLADNYDTTYVVGEAQALPDSPDDVLAVIGVNHSLVKGAAGDQSGKVDYNSLVLYNFSKFMGVASRRDVDLAGSADGYLSFVTPDATGANPVTPYKSELYVLLIARRCGALPSCVEVPYGEAGLGANENLNVMERAYMDKRTNLGPAYSEILAPLFVRLRPK